MAQDSTINTFSGGLNQDIDFILQPDGTYRNLKNGMLISMDGKNFDITLSKGNKIIQTIPPRYIETNPNLTDVPPMPIGFSSFVDDLVVFSTSNDSDAGGYGEIGVLKFSRVGDDFVSTYTPYYHHQNLKFSKYHKIEAFSFRENKNIERVYWTDNHNEPRVFDIGNPIFKTYIASGSLNFASHKKYMVLGGVIEHNGYWYGPSEYSGVLTVPTNVNGNIFQAVNANYTVVLGSPLVIEYYPLELLNWTPSRSMGDILFSEYGIGSKNFGSNIYFYRLYDSIAKTYTSWSYPSSPIHILGNNDAAFTGGTPYNNSVGNGSATTIVLSDKSVKIKISDVDTNFDTIELCCMEFTQVNDIIYSTKIVDRQAITSSVVYLEDSGSRNLGNVTISDLTLFPANILKVKTLTTDKNYILISNLTERNEFNLDLSGVKLNQVEYPMVSHPDITVCTNGNIPADLSPSVSLNPSSGTVYPNSRWIVTLGNLTTDKVEYPSGSGVFYVTGDIIKGKPYSVSVGDESTISFTGSGAVRPCTTRNKYTSIFSGKRNENYIQLKTGFWDYKDPAVSSHNRGYWSDEKYRFGILFYDKKGNPFYVKYIGDYIFNKIYAKGGLMTKDAINGTGAYTYSLNASGLKIDGLDIPQSVVDVCSGFSIVRAPRDKRIVSQALLMQTYHNTATSPQTLRQIPTAWQSDTWSYGTYYRLHSCLCPDWYAGYVLNGANADIGYIGQNIEEACWFDAPPVATYNGDRKNMVSKLFTNVAPDGTNRDRTLRNLNGNGSYAIDEYGFVPNIDGSGFTYTNVYSQAAEAATAGWNGYYACTVIGDLWKVGANPRNVGCRKLVIGADIPHYGATEEYGWDGQMTNYKKIMINMTNGMSKSNQYGGTSPYAISNTLYMSTGHFQPFNSAVLNDTHALKVNYTITAGVLLLNEIVTGSISGATAVIRVIDGTKIYLGNISGTFVNGETITGGTSLATGVIVSNEFTYTFNNIEIFGGDCFTNLIDFGYGLWDDDYNVGGDSFGYSIWYPCECNVNYNLRRGRKVSNKDMYPNGQMAYNANGNTYLESFSYNKSYSTDGINILYPALPVNYVFTNTFEYRTRFAGIKYPGESVDSYRKFLINDYKDLDGRLGEINNIRSKDGRVIVWQNKGVSSVPVLERQLLGAASGAATTIGTGGIVDRFDPITSYFGNQHQHGLVTTEYGYMWFDMRNRAMCIMDNGGGIQEISLVKGLNQFFNTQFNEGNVSGLSISDVYNTNTDHPEIPLMGYGIIGCYDPRYKMSYLTFKYTEDDLIDEVHELVSLTAKDFTIGYSHVLNAIVGFYDFTPGIWHTHNDLVLSSNNSKNYVYYGNNMKSTNCVVGDVVKVTSGGTNKSLYGEYVCIKPVTLDTFPPTNPIYNPLYSPSIYWVKINDESKIYLQSFNTLYCKFYGKIYDHELEIIVNPKTDNAVTFLNLQLKGNDVNYTSLYCSTDNQSASDVNITSTSRAYRYVNKSWLSTLPLSSKGRATDHYVKIKFVLKNYVTNPTVAINKNKIVQFIKTWFVGKK